MLDAIKGLIGLSSFSTTKLVVILAMLSVLSGTLIWLRQSVYESGYNAAIVAQVKVNKEAEKRLQETYEAKLKVVQSNLNRATSESTSQRQKAMALQKLLDNTSRTEVIREIPKLVTKCNDLGVSYDSMFKSFVGEAPIINNE